MIYLGYQASADALDPVRAMARTMAGALPELAPGAIETGDDRGSILRAFWAACQIFAGVGLSHRRPNFDIHTVRIGGRAYPIEEAAVLCTPFSTLLHFRKPLRSLQPKVLLVAPMSGHFATLLRATVRTLLPEHDVYLTDWHNARDVPVNQGRFGLDEYVEHLIAFMEELGPAHVIAVCQPCVQVLTAVAAMAEKRHPAQPRSMTLMAGPIDTRINPGKVNELARSQTMEWFERNLIDTVPLRYRGARRKVYPGFIQLMAFMAMNLERHINAHGDLFASLAKGDWKKAEQIKAFYDEYLSVSDLPAEFYLETVRTVFQEHALPLGRMSFKGKPIDLKSIRRTALLTIEGEKDDICPVGQTVAAHDLLTGLRPYMKRHHLQPGAGHYGVFSGKRWEGQVYPLVREFVRAND
ncbi:MAG TPA: polyhydroxyalkanoate depolymerase [Candidatus Cybelea sp.]|nr:polyhydroxyalkanoate depolymerase [Candidatus Cybelea sp.]